MVLLPAACGDDSVPTTPGALDDGIVADTSENPTEPSDDVPTADAGPDRRAELIGRWEIVNYTIVAGGGLTNIIGDVTPFLEFAPDGSLTFQTGCNGATARWETNGGYFTPSSALDDTPEGQAIAIVDIAKEDVICDGFLGEQDADIGANLETATRFVVGDDGGLRLFDEFILVVTEPAG